MRRARAALGSALFLPIAPGIVAGLIPWSITHWRPDAASPLIGAVGGCLIAVGVTFLVRAFARFVTEGFGTPAPVAPTQRLVTGGEYRYVRNPMYLAVAAAIVGQALLFGSLALLGYALLFGVVVFGFVRLYEEPMLRERYGNSYESYCRAVPGWLPRRHAWDGD